MVHCVDVWQIIEVTGHNDDDDDSDNDELA